MLRAVLFDLDDTLFDHQSCSRDALGAVQQLDAGLAGVPMPELESLHGRFLEQLHADVMLGRVPLEEARRERFRRLLRATHTPASESLVAAMAAAYRDRYKEVRRPIRGAAALLAALKPRVLVGIVSNNLFDEQMEKLSVCGLQPFVDALIVSERVGVSKPHPAIFAAALEELRCAPDAVVMVGDSFAADIIGARAAMIGPIWFNPSRLTLPAGEEPVRQLQSLEPVARALDVIWAARG